MPWYGFGLSAAVLAATAAILEKWLLKRMNVWQMSAWFSLVTVALVLPILWTSKASLSSLSPTLWGVILLKSLFEAVQFVCVMMGIKRLGISITLPLMALSPGLVAIAASLVISDPLTLPQWGGLMFMIVGMYVIQLKGNEDWWKPFVKLVTEKNQWVISIALLASVTVALLDKTILSAYKVSPQLFISVQQWCLAGVFLTILGIRKGIAADKAIKWNPKILCGLLFLAVITIGYRFLQMKGVMIAPVALVLSARRTSVVMASLVGGALFKEEGFLRRSIAAAIVAGGALLLAQIK